MAAQCMQKQFPEIRKFDLSDFIKIMSGSVGRLGEGGKPTLSNRQKQEVV